MPSHDFTIFADYFQFYIQDEPADGDLSEAWSDEAVARLLAVAPGVVGIGTVRNLDVPVSIEILDKEPILTLSSWDHVVECSMSVQSGRIVVAGCTDYFPDAVRIEVAPGTYRVRVRYSGLNSLSPDGLDGDDRYRLELWQAPAIEPTVIKQRAV
ncbi:hypothetical protein [Pseudoxanthomonas dokdonensis]|uniref:Uncharacterized protein n=1 Tax=Pseudoxanthomonas dokdonensis TaxID=344882 RepID=A0A0R0CNZ0_9GAMM|nr:hypothetical protein [Pseudoxanthomonas dokdonensis]KRG67550.1 hypothetical protein ABB29_15420 [Pseudoxanthomonas dokdonensis]